MRDFNAVMADVRRLHKMLLASPKHTVSRLPKQMPGPGIYLFSDKGRVLYVGRTNNLRQRLLGHTRSNHFQATFAFLLTRRRTGRTKATYQKKGSRADLLNDPTFGTVFARARHQIRKMDVRFVEVKDPTKQALLEIYSAFKTRAQHNNFDNH